MGVWGNSGGFLGLIEFIGFRAIGFRVNYRVTGLWGLGFMGVRPGVCVHGLETKP